MTGTSGAHATRWKPDASVSATREPATRRGVNWADAGRDVQTAVLPTSAPTVPAASSYAKSEMLNVADALSAAARGSHRLLMR